MFKAGMFENFKGATTLLLWGDRDGMGALLTGLSALHQEHRDQFVIHGPGGDLTICSQSENGEGSTLRAEGDRLRWSCSRETIDLAGHAVELLLHEAGHQFFAVEGLAEQVIVSRDEYPSDLR